MDEKISEPAVTVSQDGRWPPNPFSPGALLEPEWFAGRREALEQLRKAVRDNWPLAGVRGPRGIGKTALVRRLMAGADLRSVYIDVRDHVHARDIARPEAALQGIVKGLVEEISLDYLLPPHIDPQRATDAGLWRQALAELCTIEAPRLVLILDEMDFLDVEARRRVVRFAGGRVRLLRPPLWVFVIGEAWGEISGHVEDGERVPSLRLDLLEQDDILELLKRFPEQGLFSFDPGARAAVCEQTAGHPLFLAALLDAVYDLRWLAGDRSTVTREDVWRAVARVESRPPERIRHALRQAGPAALRVLHVLAEEGREALSVQDLMEVFRSEWPGWERDVGETLEGLHQTALLRKEGGIWSHRIPMLSAYITSIDRADIAAGDRPPRPDAWVAFRVGEDFEKDGCWDEACEAYQHSADLDGDFWLPRWHLARLRLERARRSEDPAERGEDLREAKRLLEKLNVEVTSRSDHQSIRNAFGEALVELAEALEPIHPERIGLLSTLQQLDSRLEPKAADLVAQTEAARLLKDGLGRNPTAWGRQARRFLREHPYVGSARLRRELARLLARRIDDEGRNPEEIETVRDLARYVAPVVLEPTSAESGVLPLWEALVTWARPGQVPRPQGEAWFEPAAWEVLLLEAPPELEGKLINRLESWLEQDFVLAFEKGAAGEDTAERLAQILVDPKLFEVLGAARQREFLRQVEDLIYRGAEDPNHRLRILAPLGRVLAVFDGSHAMSSEVGALLDLFAQTWSQVLPTGVPVSEAAVEAWRELLSCDARSGMKASFPLLERAPRVSLEALSYDEKEEVQGWLGHMYRIEDRAPISLPGFSREELKHVLSGYLARDRQGRQVMIRAFRLASPNQETYSLMRTIWDRERRALASLSTSLAGRALLRYVESRLLDEVALLVTEWAGTSTLRDLIRQDPDESLRVKMGEEKFWRRFTPFLDALDGLHRNGFLHRTLSPEVIYTAGSEGEGGGADTMESRDPSRPGTDLRLSHFEGSVYLRGLRSRGKYRARPLDRYTAPEALRAALGIPDRLRGETFATDLYALGLILFECLIEPFKEGDLGVFASPDAYGPEEQRKHEEWLIGLRLKVEDAYKKRKIERYEHQILMSLLEFDVRKRPGSLEKPLSLLHQAVFLKSTRFEEPLPVFTTLSKRENYEDPRDDPRCVAFFLRRVLPEVDLAEANELKDPAALAEMMREDLRGAAVFLNRNFEDQPLILRSRSGTLYRLQPFRWDFLENQGEKEKYLDIAYLEVARPTEGDEPFGEPLGTLVAGVQLFDLDESLVSRYIRNRRPTDPGWETLFLRAEKKYIGETERQQRNKRERLLDVLRTSIEVEYKLAWREASFMRAFPNTCLVRSPDPSVNLAAAVSVWLSYDLLLEVARHRNPASIGTVLGLTVSDLDIEAGTVDLSQGFIPEALPEEGVLRPAANRGVAGLYRRRRQILQELRHDVILLDSVVNPESSTIELSVGRPLQFILPELDRDKQEIVQRQARIRPLLLVQGPPGTGKTTLATEIVLQKLKEVPNARILLTSQAHNPLDNLLERLLQERDRNPEAKEILDRIEIVRIPSGNRTDAEYGERARTKFPYERANDLFRRLRRHSEENRRAVGLVGRVARAVLERLAPYASAPNSLLRRVEESANLVFVTTNARDIEAALPLSFDLVIVEEAARCVPMELLGTMRLSRQWLLIGDHKQLPPFGFEEVLAGVRERFEEEILRQKERLSSLKKAQQAAAERELERLRELREILPGYMHLFRHLHEDVRGLHAALLETQWRMHPFLGTMVSEVFYDGKSVRNPQGEEYDALVKRRMHPFRQPAFLRGKQLVWIDFDAANSDPACAEHRGPGGELENDAERRTAVAFLRELDTARQVPDIAIITPYRRQAEVFRGLMRQDKNWFDAFGVIEERIFTVDSFQGRQAGTIVLSLVRNNGALPGEPRKGVGFLVDERRGTVMFSRAERLLVVLGCSALFKRFPETKWIMDIYSRAHRIHWLELLPAQERVKLAQQRQLRQR